MHAITFNNRQGHELEGGQSGVYCKAFRKEKVRKCCNYNLPNKNIRTIKKEF